jgi:hypothetical protein
MIAVERRITIDSPWLELEPIRLGDVPRHLPTPDLYVTVAENSHASCRIDLYRAASDESYAFTDAQIWRQHIVIGFGN